jgi:hypothetical protein
VLSQLDNEMPIEKEEEEEEEDDYVLSFTWTRLRECD